MRIIIRAVAFVAPFAAAALVAAGMQAGAHLSNTRALGFVVVVLVVAGFVLRMTRKREPEPQPADRWRTLNSAWRSYAAQQNPRRRSRGSR